MSEHWTILCDSCGEYGPDIMRSAGRGVRLSNYWPRFHPDFGADGKIGDIEESWGEFMEKHGYHRLMLVHE